MNSHVNRCSAVCFILLRYQFFNHIGRDQNVFDFREGFPIRDGEEGYIYLGEVSSLYVCFPILKRKILKIQTFLPAAPSVSIFTFSDLRYTEGFKFFNTKSNFFYSRSSFFSPLSGHSKPTKPMKLLSFLSICCMLRAL